MTTIIRTCGLTPAVSLVLVCNLCPATALASDTTLYQGATLGFNSDSQPGFSGQAFSSSPRASATTPASSADRQVAGSASFFGLGAVPAPQGETRAMTPRGVSADGQVIVGEAAFISADPESGALYAEAFRWTRTRGLEFLGDLPGKEYFSEAYAVSADGQVVVGFSRSSLGSQAFRWSPTNGMTGLIGTAYELPAFASSVTDNGDVIVGSATSPNLSDGFEAFRLTNVGIEMLGGLPNSIGSTATDVSADGQVVVGRSRSAHELWQAFIWTPQNGMLDLGTLPGEAQSYANAVSADGATVVGASSSESTGPTAFRWSTRTGMRNLDGGDETMVNTIAHDVSGDGSAIVGEALLSGAPTPEAFVWDDAHGARQLDVVLRSNGADLRGWTLAGAFAISEDGRTVAGHGLNPNGIPEAWVAILPAHPTLLPTTDEGRRDDDQNIDPTPAPNPRDDGGGGGANDLAALLCLLIMTAVTSISRRRPRL